MTKPNLEALLAERAALPGAIRASIVEGPPGRLAQLRKRAREIGGEIERAGDLAADEQATSLRARIAQLETEAREATAAYHEAQAAHAALKGGAHTTAREQAYATALQLERPATDSRAQLKHAREQLEELVTRTLLDHAPLVRSLPHAPGR